MARLRIPFGLGKCMILLYIFVALGLDGGNGRGVVGGMSNDLMGQLQLVRGAC